ncbi:MAG: glycerate kinase [Candidatus Malihini olakiniferum]
MKKIILGISDSVKNDSSVGMAEALGVHFYDEAGNIFPGSGSAKILHHNNISGLDSDFVWGDSR